MTCRSASSHRSRSARCSTCALISILGHLVSIGTQFAFKIVCVGILVLRFRQPDLERPFRTPIGPIAGIVSCGWLMYSADRHLVAPRGVDGDRSIDLLRLRGPERGEQPTRRRLIAVSGSPSPRWHVSRRESVAVEHFGAWWAKRAVRSAPRSEGPLVCGTSSEYTLRLLCPLPLSACSATPR